MAWNEPGPGRDPWNRGPQGGGKGPQLPDLPKLLKKLRTLLGLSGSKGRPPSASLAGLVVVAIVVVWLFSGFYTVDAQERGVVLRFGSIARVAQPGLGWHLPWPVGRVTMVNVTKVRQASTQDTLMTKDHNLVDAGMTIQFRVSSARAYLYHVADPDGTLTQAAKSALRSVVSGYDVDAVLGNAQQEIGIKTRQLLQHTLDEYQTGLQVTDVSLNNVQPPQQVQAAFADAIKAGDDATKLQGAAESYAHARLPRANAQAAEEIAAAHAYADRVVASASGEKARFDAVLAEYQTAPKATRDRLYADALREIIQDNRIVLVGSAGTAVTLNVRTGTQVPAESATTLPPPATPAVKAPETSGDNGSGARSRERDGGSR